MSWPGDFVIGCAVTIVVGFELQLAHTVFGEFYVIAYLAEILRLDELSIRVRMAVEITNFHNLFHTREWITWGTVGVPERYVAEPRPSGRFRDNRSGPGRSQRAVALRFLLSEGRSDGDQRSS